MNDAVLRASTPSQVSPRGTTEANKFIGSPRTDLAFITASADFGQGVVEGLTDSLKSAWGLVSHDMWQAKTYSELTTTITALGLLSPPNLWRGLSDAQAIDNLFGTHVARRQLEILQAIYQLAQEIPRWTARQWGHAVGVLVGNLLLAKGAGAVLKASVQGVGALNKIAAARYLTKYTTAAEAFSDVKGFRFSLGQRSFKVHESLQSAKRGRWLSNQQFATSAEAVDKLALDYPGSKNFASQRWSARKFGIYIEGTTAPQANPLGGGGNQLLKIWAQETHYVEVPYK